MFKEDIFFNRETFLWIFIRGYLQKEIVICYSHYMKARE